MVYLLRQAERRGRNNLLKALIQILIEGFGPVA